MNVAAYIRVSSEEQRERQTIKGQRQELETWAKREGLNIVEWYPDDGVSGDVPFALREQGARLLEDARKGRFQGVISYSISRLGRRVEDTLAVISTLHEDLGLDYRSQTEDIPVTGAFGKLVLTVLAAIAELEKANILERTRIGTLRIAREGKWPCGKARYGYRRNKEGYLELLAHEADVVVFIFDCCLKGMGAARIAKLLTARGIPTPMTGRRKTPCRGEWSSGVVQKILRDTAYVGVYIWRKRRVNRKVTATGVVTKVVKAPADEHVLLSVPPIVSIETFQAVSDRLHHNRKRSPGNTKHFYLLGGLVRCGCCHYAYGAHTNVSEGRPAVYSCHNRRVEKVKPCYSPQVQAQWLEDAVREQIRAFVREPGAVVEELRRHLEEDTPVPVCRESEIAALQAKIEAKQDAKRRTSDLMADGIIDRVDGAPKIDSLRAEIAALEEAREALEREETTVDDWQGALGDVEALLVELRGAIESASDQTWREVVELLVEEVTVTRKARRGCRGIPRAVGRFRFLPRGCRVNRASSSWQLKARLILTRELDLPKPRTGKYQMV